MYEMKGIRRLMAAVLLRAIRDVYAGDKVVRYQATEWLQSNSIEHINRYGLKISALKLNRWIENGFCMDDLSYEKLNQTSNIENRKTWRKKD